MDNLTQVECEGGFYYVGRNVSIDPAARIGVNTRVWDDAKIGFGVTMGRHCIIGAGVHIEEGVPVGNFCKVQRGVTLYAGVALEDYVFFGPNATTTNDRNPRAFGAWEKSQTRIGIGASIGANATLIAGNDIGAFSLVGAGAVVTREVPAANLVIGNPAEFAGWVDVGGNVISRDKQAPSIVRLMSENPSLSIQNYLASQESLKRSNNA